MRFPTPNPSKYALNTAIVVATLAVLQYTGFVVDGSAGLEPAFLAAVAVTYPAFTYLLAVLAANVDRIPE
jgi:hypothetical protein